MSAIRTFLEQHRWLAVWLVVATLLMKVMVPAGFMPGLSDGQMLVELCTSQGAQTLLVELAGQSDGHDPADHKTFEPPCAFSGLSSPALAAVDPVLLAIAIAFILATGFLATPRAPQATRSFLRPPPIGPPQLS
ncbi:MAG TPA: DUF2946 family protein [Phenylobacterium sp.]|uniref:DUF2946 family protein n=1 Tax=Phenylobacterium sp. TaxID=1871053 RepID=UPI002F933E90